jgi:hypothetical protein
MAHSSQNDAILPVDAREQNIGQMYNSEDTGFGYNDQDKLGEREKNSEGSVDVGSAEPHLNSSPAESTAGHGRFAVVRRYRRPMWHLFFFLLFTGWWIASLILHRNDKNWVVPFLLWLAITIRIVTYYIPIRYVSDPILWTWNHTAVAIHNKVPERLRTPGGALIAIAAIIVGAFASEETEDNTRANRAVSLFGLAVILFTFWATSRHRRAVNWRTVIVGMLAQYIIGLFVLRTGVGYDIFSFIAARAGNLLGFARDGVAFITSADTAALPMFFFGVIPAIICKSESYIITCRADAQSSSLWSRHYTTLDSSNGSSENSQLSSSGPSVSLELKLSSLLPPPSSVKESLLCLSDLSFPT